MSKPKEVVLVTGANGFLGQFIIKLLQERDDDVTEIRAFDWTGYTKRLDFKDRVPVEVIVGDVRNADALVKACEDVDCVIHSASLIDVTAKPDAETMRQINVKGTRNVIDACIERNVSRLVFTSSVDVVIGSQEFPYMQEDKIPIPRHFLMGDYAATKYAAETLVLKANDKPLSRGDACLQTLVLRPVVTYGEGDPYFVVGLMREAAKRGGTITRVTRSVAILQPAYVGNVAWAHLVAKSALKSHPDQVSGLPYFITDDTLPCNCFDFVEPILATRGLRVSSNGIPFWLLYCLLLLAHWIVSAMSLVYEPPIKLPLLNGLQYICKTYVVNRTRATYRLRYSPIFQPEEAMQRSMQYYKNLPL